MKTPAPLILADPRELTPDWLGAALQSAGLDVRVRSLRSEPVGTGQMAHNERIFIEYADAPADAPASLVGKFPSPNESSRGAGAAGGYLAEVRFYTDLAGKLSIRTPACFYGAIAEDRATFTLLLEDLAPARQGDQIQGASDDQIEAAVVNLAGLHAPLWNHPSLRQIDWISVGTNAGYGEFLRAATPLFLERYADRLATEDAETLAAFAERIDRWVATQPEHETLVHGDYRLDNLLVDGVTPTAIIDWEMANVSGPLTDLAWWVWIDKCNSEGLGVPRLAGLPSPDEIYERWHQATGRSVGSLPWFELFAVVRYAVILELKFRAMREAHQEMGIPPNFVAPFIPDLLQAARGR